MRDETHNLARELEAVLHHEIPLSRQMELVVRLARHRAGPDDLVGVFAERRTQGAQIHGAGTHEYVQQLLHRAHRGVRRRGGLPLPAVVEAQAGRRPCRVRIAVGRVAAARSDGENGGENGGEEERGRDS